MKKIIALLLLVTLLSSCGANSTSQNDKIQKKYSTYVVKTGHIDSANKFTGYTSGIKEVMLATKVPGRITYLAKNVWDRVRVGELLASTDGAEAKNWYSTATNIVNSLYALKKQTELAYDWQIASVKAKIAQAKIGIKWVSTWLEDTKNITEKQLETAKTGIEQAKLWLETAKKNLEETKKTLEVKEKNILSGWKSAITQNFILSTNIIDFADKTLWITQKNKNFNDKFEDYLWVKDSIHLNQTKQLFKDTKKEFDEYKKFYDEKIDNKNPSKEELIEWLKIADKYSEKQKKLLKELYKVLDDSIENIYFPIAMINEYKKNISKMGSDLELTLLTAQWNYILWIKWTLQNLDDLKSNKDKAISLLEKQVELAKAGLETAQKTYQQYLAMSKWQINWVTTKKDIAESQLKEAYAGLKALEAKKQASLKEIDAKIAEANWWKSKAGVMINNWKVYSNISGVVSMKMAEVWQVINAGMPIYQIVDTSKLKVKTSVPERIFKNLQLWQKIDLAVEWYNKKITWKITLLNKVANRFTKKYDIEITIDNPKWEIPAGAMSVIVFKNQQTKTINGNPIIPNNAIISKFGLPSVYVLENWKAVLKTIKIIKMWEKNSEVSGIKSLDKIITLWKENIFDGEVLENK